MGRSLKIRTVLPVVSGKTLAMVELETSLSM